MWTRSAMAATLDAGISPARNRSMISGEMKVKFSNRETVAVVEPIASATVLRLEYVGIILRVSLKETVLGVERLPRIGV